MCDVANVEECVFRLTGGVEVPDTKDGSVHREGSDSSLGVRESMSHEIRESFAAKDKYLRPCYFFSLK